MMVVEGNDGGGDGDDDGDGDNNVACAGDTLG